MEAAGESLSQQCSSCDSSSARCWCLDCNEAMCNDCVSAHRRVTVTRSHRLINRLPQDQTHGDLSLTEPEHLQLPSGNLWSSPIKFCRVHPSEPLQVFCFTCSLLTCRDCQLMAHKHHRYQFASEAQAILKNQLKACAQPIRAQRDKVRRSLQDMTNRLTQIDQNNSRLKDQLQKTYLTMTKLLKTRMEGLVKQIEKVCETEQELINQRMVKLKQLLQTQMTLCETAEKARTTSDLSTLLTYTTQMKSQLKDLLVQDSSPPPAMTEIKVTSNRASLEAILRFGDLSVSWVPFNVPRTSSENMEAPPPPAASSIPARIAPIPLDRPHPQPLTTSHITSPVPGATFQESNLSPSPLSSNPSSTFHGPTSSPHPLTATCNDADSPVVVPVSSRSSSDFPPPSSFQSCQFHFRWMQRSKRKKVSSSSLPMCSSTSCSSGSTSFSIAPTSSMYSSIVQMILQTNSDAVSPEIESLPTSSSGLIKFSSSVSSPTCPPPSCPPPSCPPPSCSPPSCPPPSCPPPSCPPPSCLPPTLPSPTLPSPTLPPPTLPSSTLPSPTLQPVTHPSPTLPPPTLPSSTIPPPTLPPPTLPSSTIPPPTLPPPTLPSSTLPSPTLLPPNLPPPTLQSHTLPPPTLPTPTLQSPTYLAITYPSLTCPPSTCPAPTYWFNTNRASKVQRVQSISSVITFPPDVTSIVVKSVQPVVVVNQQAPPVLLTNNLLSLPSVVPQFPIMLSNTELCIAPTVQKKTDLMINTIQSKCSRNQKAPPEPAVGHQSDRQHISPQQSPVVTDQVREEPAVKLAAPETSNGDVEAFFPETSDGESEETSHVIEQLVEDLSQWQPTVPLVRLPLSLPQPGCPLPVFRLVRGSGEDEVYLQELNEDSEIESDEDTVDFTEPLSSPESPVSLEILSCAACGSASTSIICSSCGRGYHRRCHVPPVGPDIWSEWLCSLCQDLSDPLDPYSSDRPSSPQMSSLSLQNLRRCESLLLHLKVEGCSRLSESRWSRLQLISEHLSCDRSPSYQTAAQVISDIWTVFESSQDDALDQLQQSFQKKLEETLSSELHPSLLKGPNSGPADDSLSDSSTEDMTMDKDEDNMTDKDEDNMTDKDEDNMTDKDEDNMTDKDEDNMTDKDEDNMTDKDEDNMTDKDEDNMTDKDEDNMTDKDEDNMTDNDEDNMTDKDEDETMGKEEGKTRDKDEKMFLSKLSQVRKRLRDLLGVKNPPGGKRTKME